MPTTLRTALTHTLVVTLTVGLALSGCGGQNGDADMTGEDVRRDTGRPRERAPTRSPPARG